MRTIRWILFVPGAFVASVLAGAAGNLLGSFWGSLFGWMTWDFLSEDRLAWIFSGLFSGAAFVWAGAHIAPEVTRLVKWLLVGLLAVIGLMSVGGGFVEGGNRVAAWAGAMMVVIAVVYAQMPAGDFKSES